MKLAFLGDTALIGKYDITRYGEEAVFARFNDLLSTLKSCDHIIANLETPLTYKTKTIEAKTLALRSHPENIKVLQYLGVDGVSLANNHIFDYGAAGLADTTKALKSAGIQYCGLSNRPLYFSDKAVKVGLGGFCCYTTNGWHYGEGIQEGKLNVLKKKQVQQFIAECHLNNAYPIGCVHWGEENTHYPRKEHIFLAEQILADSKVSLIGHHPHVMQGVKRNDNGIVAYSLGNFCFDDVSSELTNIKVTQTEDNAKGMILILTINEALDCTYEVITYADKGDGLYIQMQFRNEINAYSEALDNIKDWSEYQNRRNQEMKEAFSARMGKRDGKWLLGHLNRSSLEAVLQRKRNAKAFYTESCMWGEQKI